MRKGFYRRDSRAVLGRLADVAQARVEAIAPRKPATVHTARRFFPFTGARQPVRALVFRRTPLGVGHRVVPTDARDGCVQLGDILQQVWLEFEAALGVMERVTATVRGTSGRALHGEG